MHEAKRKIKKKKTVHVYFAKKYKKYEQNTESRVCPSEFLIPYNFSILGEWVVLSPWLTLNKVVDLEPYG